MFLRQQADAYIIEIYAQCDNSVVMRVCFSVFEI